MDLRKLIQQLTLEKEMIERAIANLEGLQTTLSAVDVGLVPKRRGRKGMEPEERRAVSERLKNYWKNRRASA